MGHAQYGIHAFTITYSDVPAYKINYDLKDESYFKAMEVVNGVQTYGDVYIVGTNAAENPEFYEQGNAVTFAAPTRKYSVSTPWVGNITTRKWIFVDDAYEFDGWYDNAEFSGSPVT